MSSNNCEYITIDFETANSSLTSACSVGLVGAKNGKIVFEKYYLINPEEDFLSYNTLIHGITYEDVKNEKTFPELWPEIKELRDGNILFAHSASFDMNVLKSLLEKYKLPFPNIRVGCTLKLSRIAFKDSLTSFKLSAISNYLEVSHNHHNAISDASICYYIIERCKRIYQVDTIQELFEEVGLCFGVLDEKKFRNCYNKLTEKIKSKSELMKGMVISFTGKPSSMTKGDFKKVIYENGGLYSKEITRVINTFVVFPSPSKKHLQALELIKNKKEIKEYTEEEIMEIVYGSRIHSKH